MKKQFADYISFYVVAVMIIMIMGVSVNAGEKVAVKDKSVKVELPDNIKDLTALEASLTMKAKVVSRQLFKVLSDMRLEKTKIVKNDPEIKKLNDEISKLRTKVEKLTLEKSKDMKTWSEKREELVVQHDDLREQLMAVKSKKMALLKKEKASTESLVTE